MKFKNRDILRIVHDKNKENLHSKSFHLTNDNEIAEHLKIEIDSDFHNKLKRNLYYLIYKKYFLTTGSPEPKTMRIAHSVNYQSIDLTREGEEFFNTPAIIAWLKKWGALISLFFSLAALIISICALLKD